MKRSFKAKTRTKPKFDKNAPPDKPYLIRDLILSQVKRPVASECLAPNSDTDNVSREDRLETQQTVCQPVTSRGGVVWLDINVRESVRSIERLKGDFDKD